MCTFFEQLELLNTYNLPCLLLFASTSAVLSGGLFMSSASVVDYILYVAS